MLMVLLMIVCAGATLALAFKAKEKPLHQMSLKEEQAYDKFETKA